MHLAWGISDIRSYACLTLALLVALPGIRSPMGESSRSECLAGMDMLNDMFQRQVCLLDHASRAMQVVLHSGICGGICGTESEPCRELRPAYMH